MSKKATVMTKKLWVELGFNFSPKTPTSAKNPGVWRSYDLWKHSAYPTVVFRADEVHHVEYVYSALLHAAYHAGRMSVQNPIREALGIRT